MNTDTSSAEANRHFTPASKFDRRYLYPKTTKWSVVLGMVVRFLVVVFDIARQLTAPVIL